jgi:SAM-dependent methyltransferase
MSFERMRAVCADEVRLDELNLRYQLSSWSRCCNHQDWVESLYVLDVLDRLLPKPLPLGRGLDVGAKNGSMLPGLVTAVGRGCDAVELDAHRRYLWGSTRRVYGERMAREFSDCRFIAADVRTLEGPWAVVTWWLPFLSRAPLEAWGLPERFLAPRELLRHVADRVLPGGVLFIVNQGKAEAELQQSLFADLGLDATSVGRIESVFSPYQKPRFGWLVRLPQSLAC